MSNEMNETKVFAIKVSVSGITGERQIASLESLGVDLTDLPQGIRTLWKQGVVPTEHLRPTDRFRKEIEAHLYKHAVKSELGWVCRHEDAKNLLHWLKAKKKEHDHYVAMLVLKWDEVRREAQEELRQQFGSHPAFPKLLMAMQRAQPDALEIRSKLTLNYSITGFYQAESTGDPELDVELKNSAVAGEEGLVQQLFRDTVKIADELFTLFTSGEKNRTNRTINRRSLRKVEDYLVKKIKSLSFLDKRLIALAGGVEQALAPLVAMPAGKQITAADCGELVALLAVLSSEARLKARLDALQPGEVLSVASFMPNLSMMEDEEDEPAIVADAESSQEEEVDAPVAAVEAEDEAEEEVVAPVVAAEPVVEPEAPAPAPAVPEVTQPAPVVAPVSFGAMSWG